MDNEKLLRELANIALRLQRDVWTLELALRESGALTAEQIASARASVEDQLKAASGRLGQEIAERLLAILKEFEGPPQ